MVAVRLSDNRTGDPVRAHPKYLILTVFMDYLSLIIFLTGKDSFLFVIMASEQAVSKLG